MSRLLNLKMHHQSENTSMIASKLLCIIIEIEVVYVDVVNSG
jgi:hypothetical protein